MRVNKISLEYCKGCFNWDIFGNITWKIKSAKCMNIGDSAGYLHPSGYYYIKIKGKATLTVT